jgi:protein TonB
MATIRGAMGGESWAPPPRRSRAELAAAAIALGLHAAIAAGLWLGNPSRVARRETMVEMEVVQRRPPPPELRPAPPAPAPPPAPPPRPRVVPRRIAVLVPKAAPQPPAPPPPAEQPPKPAPEAPPIFGVSTSSVVSGDPAAMAVPVGNTLMTKERAAAKPGETPKPYAAEGTHPLVPVADIYIAQLPSVLHQVNSADIYPAEAYKMGIEGKVDLKITIDETGEVRQVKVIGRAGHGFDEAARDALRRFKFSPARTSDGKPVVASITYRFSFDMAR